MKNVLKITQIVYECSKITLFYHFLQKGVDGLEENPFNSAPLPG